MLITRIQPIEANYVVVPCQHVFKNWPVAIQRQAISRTNADTDPTGIPAHVSLGLNESRQPYDILSKYINITNTKIKCSLHYLIFKEYSYTNECTRKTYSYVIQTV